MAQTSFTNWFEEAFGDEGTKFGLAVRECLHEEQSAFQKLQIFATETFGNLLVLDGCVMLTTRDNFIYHEMLTHPALFLHPKPSRVVVVGGGDCGALLEVLKHPDVTSAVQVEIDERVTRLSEQYFPELCTINNDHRAEFVFDDAAAWIQAQPDESIDVLIIDSTDPVGPAEQLFGPQFLAQAFRTLSNDGIIVQQSESPLLHHNTIMHDLRSKLSTAGFKNPRPMLFPQPVYPTGWWSATIATKAVQPHIFREQVYAHRAFQTRYYNRDIHYACFATPEFMQTF